MSVSELHRAADVIGSEHQLGLGRCNSLALITPYESAPRVLTTRGAG